MNHTMNTLQILRTTCLCAVGTLLFAVILNGVAAEDKPAAAILSNGDFQSDADGDGVPDGWAPPKGGVSYAKDGTNVYLHLESPKPDEMVMTYRQVRIPK